MATRIGMTLPTMLPGLTRDLLLDWSRRIEAGPFSSIAAGERITYPTADVLLSLAAAATATERVRIVPTVVVLPLHAEVLVAKQLATLDILSGGRLSVGLGVGGREEDYRALGVPFEHRLGRMERQVARMRRIWAGEPPFDGAAPVGPPPTSPGGPELLAGSLSTGSIRRAARWADGLLGFGFGPDPAEVAVAFDAARAAWAAAGRDRPPRLVTSFWYALGDDGAARMEHYARSYLRVFGEDAARGLARLCRTKSATALRDVVRRLSDLGADEVMLVPTTIDPGDVDRVADVLAGETAAGAA